MPDVQFFDPKAQAEVNRRRMMAQMMMKQGQQPDRTEVISGVAVKQSPLAAMAKAIQQGIGGYQAGQADNIEAQDTQKRQELLARAITGLKDDPTGSAQLLMSSPSTSDMGLKLYLGQIKADAQRGQLQDKYAREDANWQRDADLKRELALLRTGGGAPTVDPDTGEIIPGYSNKPLPVGALKLQQEALDGLANAEGIAKQSEFIQGQINDGTLDLGPVANKWNALKNWSGFSDEQSLAYGNLEQTLEKIRNDSLRLNKGVQTEGDAERAYNEVVKNKNDPKLLAQAMQKLQSINDRGAELQKLQVNNIRNNYGAAPMNFDSINALPSPVPAQPVGGAALGTQSPMSPPVGGQLGGMQVPQLNPGNLDGPIITPGMNPTGLGNVNDPVPGLPPAGDNLQQVRNTPPSGAVQIQSDQDYDALPSGTEFIGPDGVKRRKP